MAKSIMERVADAKADVADISPAEAMKLMGRDDVLFVDVRDAPELTETGKIKGAVNVSRGMIEFRADDATPFHDPAFSKEKTVILYCATGGRSALSGKALQDLGYTDVRNLGGIQGWIGAGGEIET